MAPKWEKFGLSRHHHHHHHFEIERKTTWWNNNKTKQKFFATKTYRTSLQQVTSPLLWIHTNTFQVENTTFLGVKFHLGTDPESDSTPLILILTIVEKCKTDPPPPKKNNNQHLGATSPYSKKHSIWSNCTDVNWTPISCWLNVMSLKRHGNNIDSTSVCPVGRV